MEDGRARRGRRARRRCPTGRSGSAGPTRARDAGTCTSRASGRRLSLHGRPGSEAVAVDLPRFDVGRRRGRRGAAPGGAGAAGRRALGDDRLRPRHGPVRRRPRRAARRVARPATTTPVPYTPAWQEKDHLGARRGRCPGGPRVRPQRRGLRRALDDRHGGGDQPLVPLGPDLPDASCRCSMLGGCEGVNGGGWAHYVGQEKVRPFTGWFTLAFAYDWVRPTRHMPATPYWYLATDQWRYEGARADLLSSPLGEGRFAGRSVADLNAYAARLGMAGLPPDLRPQPARPGRPGRSGRQGGRRLRRRRAAGGAARLRGRPTPTTRPTSPGC